MREIKVVFLFVAVLLMAGCATTRLNSFQQILAQNPAIGPRELAAQLQMNPIEEKQVNSSISYQVYAVNEWYMTGPTVAVYFKDGRFVEQAPYTQAVHLNTLYKLGAIDKDEYRWQYEQMQNANFQQQQLDLQYQALQQQKEYQNKYLAIKEQDHKTKE